MEREIQWETEAKKQERIHKTKKTEIIKKVEEKKLHVEELPESKRIKIGRENAWIERKKLRNKETKKRKVYLDPNSRGEFHTIQNIQTIQDHSDHSELFFLLQ